MFCPFKSIKALYSNKSQSIQVRNAKPAFGIKMFPS